MDSGAGALNLLGEIRRLLPRAPLIALTDKAAFPYGDKAEEELCQRLLELTSHCVNIFKPASLVVACNTASTVALSALRQNFDLPVVGTVPPIKPAAMNSRTKTIALLATPGTVKRSYVDELINQFAADCQVLRFACPELAALAEQKLAGRDLCLESLRRELKPLMEHSEYEKVDALVLGCTHFSFLNEEISDILHSHITLLDPAEAVARQLQRVHRGSDAAYSCVISTGALDYAEDLLQSKGISQTFIFDI